MTLITAVYALIFYAAGTVLVGGVYLKIRRYIRTPVPLKIPTTPAPTNAGGVVMRMVREVTLFESLFKASKWTWIFGWLFHFGLLIVLLAHLRYFTEPVWFWVTWLQPFGKYAAFAMVAGLLGLWGRRVLIDRIRYISSLSDHLMLILLIAIGGCGIAMRYVVHTDVVALKGFFLGLMYFDWQPLPPDPVLLLHLALVAALMTVFPFSKLLHAPGLFFSPTRNQIDNPRERRHRNAPWTVAVETTVRGPTGSHE